MAAREWEPLASLVQLTREDSISESVSAICYLLAACIFFVEWIRGGFRNIFVLGYAFLFLVVGGEEISWGQRIIGLQTPEELLRVAPGSLRVVDQ